MSVLQLLDVEHVWFGALAESSLRSSLDPCSSRGCDGSRSAGAIHSAHVHRSCLFTGSRILRGGVRPLWQRDDWLSFPRVCPLPLQLTGVPAQTSSLMGAKAELGKNLIGFPQPTNQCLLVSASHGQAELLPHPTPTAPLLSSIDSVLQVSMGLRGRK